MDNDISNQMPIYKYIEGHWLWTKKVESTFSAWSKYENMNIYFPLILVFSDCHVLGKLYETDSNSDRWQSLRDFGYFVMLPFYYALVAKLTAGNDNVLDEVLDIE